MATSIREIVREPAPLVLKDGRIAHVRVYAVPFKDGAGEIDSATKAELNGLIETIATDCFLTAQAIGHVEPAAAKSGESLSAHRLARTRADRVQAALVARGFSASSIASVWDWQFVVGEPRVTLWVFRLNEGEDCKGEPMAKPDGKQVAALPEKDLPAQTPAAKVLPTPEVTAKPAPPPSKAATAADALPASPTIAPSPAVRAEAEQPKPPAAKPPAVKATPDQTTVVVADLGPAQTATVAETKAPPAQATQLAAARPGGGDGDAEVVFDLNSSFFSKDARNALKQFVTSLPRDRPVAVDVVVAVGGADVKESASTDPLRYNRWMAERRGSRVVEFLKENAGGRQLDFNPAYQDNDPSRSVVLKARPIR